MSALPAEPGPLDPVGIMNDLPGEERPFFLAAYQQAVREAADPAGYRLLHRLLRLYRWRADYPEDDAVRAARQACSGPADEAGRLPWLEDRIREKIERRQSA